MTGKEGRIRIRYRVIHGELRRFFYRRPKQTKWIKRALAGSGGKRRRGYLHRALKVPRGEKIPRKKLLRAARQGGKLGHRAKLALTLRSFHSKRRRR